MKASCPWWVVRVPIEGDVWANRATEKGLGRGNEVVAEALELFQPLTGGLVEQPGP